MRAPLKGIFAAIGILALGVGGEAFAYAPWSPAGGASYSRVQPNSSLLSDTDANLARDMMGTGIFGDIFDPKTAEAQRFRYEAMYADYERRRAFDQLTNEDEREFNSQMSQMGGLVSQVRSYHWRKSSSRIRKALSKEHAIRRPLEVVAIAGAMYTGAPMSFKVAPDAQINARTDVKGQRANVALNASWLSSSFDFVARAPSDRDPFGPLPADPLQREERMRFSVSRGWGIWALSSGVTYGSTTKTMSASVSKEILPNFSTSVGTTQYLRSASPGSPAGEQSVRFYYGLTF